MNYLGKSGYIVCTVIIRNLFKNCYTVHTFYLQLF